MQPMYQKNIKIKKYVARFTVPEYTKPSKQWTVLRRVIHPYLLPLKENDISYAFKSVY